MTQIIGIRDGHRVITTVTGRDQLADALARVYDGKPLAELRDEHADLHLEAADAVLAGLASLD